MFLEHGKKTVVYNILHGSENMVYRDHLWVFFSSKQQNLDHRIKLAENSKQKTRYTFPYSASLINGIHCYKIC